MRSGYFKSLITTKKEGKSNLQYLVSAGCFCCLGKTEQAVSTMLDDFSCEHIVAYLCNKWMWSKMHLESCCLVPTDVNIL